MVNLVTVIRRVRCPSIVPGTNLEVDVSTGEAGKLILYAVDEGILQFARYKNPQPLDYFFRKRALQVTSYQILDLILPDFALVQRLTAPGGDEDSGAGKYKNPFARKHKAPMTFWSGIRQVAPGTHHFSVPVPAYFSGKIRMLAYAVSEGKIGSDVKSVIARGPFVIQPQQPYAVAPGDEFDVGVLVSNNTTSQEFSVRLEDGEAGSERIEALSENPLKVRIDPGRDAAVRFRVRAKEKLGPVAIGYKVEGDGKSFKDTEELSIRPAQPFLVTSTEGKLTIDDQRKGEKALFSAGRELFREYRDVQVSVSTTPFGLFRRLY